MSDNKKNSKKIKTVDVKMSRAAPLKVQETRSAPQKSYHTREAPKKTRPKSDSK